LLRKKTVFVGIPKNNPEIEQGKRKLLNSIQSTIKYLNLWVWGYFKNKIR